MDTLCHDSYKRPFAAEADVDHTFSKRARESVHSQAVAPASTILQTTQAVPTAATATMWRPAPVPAPTNVAMPAA
eukprot:4487-Heterococcus_DN1.PRE.1